MKVEKMTRQIDDMIAKLCQALVIGHHATPQEEANELRMQRDGLPGKMVDWQHDRTFIIGGDEP